VPAFSTRPWGVLDSEGRQRYWNPLTLSIGPLLHYRLAGKFSQVEDLELAYHAIYEVLYYRDGETASVGAFRARGTDLQSLRIGGEIEASSGAGSMEMPVQLLSGHLPLLKRSGARSALAVGLGGGVTLGVMTLYPALQRLACVEASPEVVEAARLFGGPNHRALENPKVSLIVGDARNNLHHDRSRYDIIICQPTSFWVAGVGTLFTSEFYALVKVRLAPGGVVCQRLDVSRIGVEDFRMALRAFLEAFPQASLWTAGGHALLLGSFEPLEWSREWIESCLGEPAIREDLLALGIDRPEALFRYLRIEGDALLKLAGRGPLSRELFPRLEHFAPGGLFKGENALPLLLAAPPEPQAVPGFGSEAEIEGYRRRGVMLHLLEDRLSRLKLDEAVERLIEIAAEGDRWLSARAAQLVARYSLQGLDEEGRLLLRRALLVLDDPVLIEASRSLGPGTLDRVHLKERERRTLKKDWTLHLLQAQEAVDRRDPQAALEAVATARARGAPGYRLGLLEGFAHALLGDLDAAERSYWQALEGAPERERAEVLYNLGFAREKRGDFEGAAEYQQKSLALGADPIRGGLALSRCLRAAGRTAEALAAAEEVSKRRESPEALHEAALALLELGNPQAALEKLVQAAAAAPERYLKELETLEARLKSKSP